VGLIWWVFHGRERAPRHAAVAPVTVVAATAQRADMPVTLDAIGTVTPVYTNQIASQVTGQVMSVSYKEGQLVERGTPLVDIDPRPFEATLLQAQGVLERDTQVLAQAKMDLQRYRAAWAKNAIAKQQLDDQEKLVLQTEGTVKNDRGTVKYDQVQLSYCHITAPIVGRVGLRLVDPGNYVTASSSPGIVVITTMKPTTVQFTVPQDSLASVLQRMGTGANLPVTAYSSDNSRQIATGMLYAVSNQMATATGTVTLRATFANDDEALFPNEFVNIKLLVDTLQNAVLVPTPAVQTGAPGDYVYLVNANNTVSVHKVTLGPSDGKNTVIASGLSAGNIVVTDGTDRLSDGAPIKAAPARAASGASGASAASGSEAGSEASEAGAASGAHAHHKRAQDGASGASATSADAAS
jgi:multidrug efflux system membrane fusion protein